MDLLQMKYFMTVARLEHMTKAAEVLNISQPSLSIMIARLEERVGVPLFDRHGRKIRLNQFGKVYAEHVEQIFQVLEQGESIVRDMAGLNKGCISLAVSITNVIPELLGKFLRQYPDVQFRQVFEPTPVVKKMLENGEIDLCIASGEFDSPNLEWQPLITEEIYLVVPENHHLVGQETVPLALLKDEHFLNVRQGFWLRSFMDEQCLQAGFTPKVIFEVDEPDAIVSLIRQGIGLCFIPQTSWEMRSHLIPNKIKITNPECLITRSIAWSRKHYLSQAAQRFREFAIDYFNELQQQHNISGRSIGR
ncbi:LysR family transcriptional regulator [Brevibacillus sp. BC25]|uniref:LysR family transcriptional regulator n=1 Tax=Brevibacillus sp. BC25 TaxID=1144308 RepID=UPI000271035E|nr:LysR family transcriptional regulator [Brevibacillus sp. BC25]EJL31389.1 transcriptional regulator [Brevibacillus sp. BC25]